MLPNPATHGQGTRGSATVAGRISLWRSGTRWKAITNNDKIASKTIQHSHSYVELFAQKPSKTFLTAVFFQARYKILSQLNDKFF